MEKEKIGQFYIDNGTIISDNLTGEKYEVIDCNKEGIKTKQITAITEPKELFTSYEKLESGFLTKNISISGYTDTDDKILHLVINYMKSKEYRNKSRFQYHYEGSSKVKKKVPNTLGKLLQEFRAR